MKIMESLWKMAKSMVRHFLSIFQPNSVSSAIIFSWNKILCKKGPNFDPLWVLPTLSFFVCISVVPNFLFFKHERKKIQVHNTSVPIWFMINKESFFKRRPWDFVAKFWINKTEKLKFAYLCRNLRLDYY